MLLKYWTFFHLDNKIWWIGDNYGFVNFICFSNIGWKCMGNLENELAKGKLCIDRIGALIVSIIITFSTGFDILNCFNIPIKVPIIGMVLTAIQLSRG